MYTVHILNFCVCVCRYKKTARFDVYDLLHAPTNMARIHWTRSSCPIPLKT